MSPLSLRPALSRAGVAVFAVAVIGLAGYGIGRTESPGAVASAEAPAAPVAAVQGVSPSSYAAIVDAVAPAVVTVRVEKRASAMDTQLLDDDLFRFFGRELQIPRQRTPRRSGLGSGVITSPDGYVLTNNHVIDGADQVSVDLTDKRTFDAKVVGTDAASDLAVLKIEAQGLPTVPIGDSNQVRVGDVVLAIGNPLGVGQTVTMGIISAKGRANSGTPDSYEDFLQTDAPINQGNSGGALINLEGRLVGINSQILTPTGGSIGLGFAIPSNMARDVMAQLKSGGTVRRGKLGVGVQDVTADIATSLNLADTSGALVGSIEPGSAASRAGLQRRDVIATINGEKLADSNALRNRIAATKPGSTVALGIIRDGRNQTLNATLSEREAAQNRSSAAEERSSGKREYGAFGMTVEPLTPDLARELGLPNRKEGVVVRSVNPDGAAADARLQPGDVITEVNGQGVTTPTELKSALSAAGDRPALLLITRENAEFYRALRRQRS
jgi:Do/DeqQ family serine protease